MSQEIENLIESDHIEEVLDEAGPPPPVVVVQYRNRVMPWILVAALMGTALTLGGVLVRHRRETDHLRQQVLEARSDLERLRDRARTENTGPRPAAIDRPGEVDLAMARNPGAVGPAAAQPASVLGGAGVSGTPRASDAPPSEKPPAPTPGAAEKASPSPRPDPALATAPLPARADPVGTASAVPTATATAMATAAPPAPAPPGSPGSRSRIVTLAAIPEGPSPFDEPPVPDEKGQKPGASGPVAPPAATEPPLPSPEEAERQIREQAAKMERENDQRLIQQQADLQTLRADERRQFLEELRKALKDHGRKAGPEIEEISIRAGRDEDPVKLRQAYRVIGSGRQSQRVKVSHLRAIGVSESVILDYLANELHNDLGARNGPRTRNDVWVQAARLLLSYELPPARPGDVPPAPGQTVPRPAAVPRPVNDTSRAP